MSADHNGREMYDEVSALMGAVTKAFSLTPEAAVHAVEAGDIAVDMGEDERGLRYVRLRYAGKAVRLYQGAMLYEEKADSEDAACDTGCGCGR
jgi:hypothetical protein